MLRAAGFPDIEPATKPSSIVFKTCSGLQKRIKKIEEFEIKLQEAQLGPRDKTSLMGKTLCWILLVSRFSLFFSCTSQGWKPRLGSSRRTLRARQRA